jgi:hypothetical protein
MLVSCAEFMRNSPLIDHFDEKFQIVTLAVQMKVLFSYQNPFALAHGGLQIQIEQTKAALERAGVVVEPLRWWDDTQTGDILQHFTRMPTSLIRMAQRKGMKAVMVELMTEQGSRSSSRLKLQRLVTRIVPLVLPQVMVCHFNWDSYHLADACVALTPWEAKLMRYIFAAPAHKVHVIPNGVEEIFLTSPSAERGRWLVCTAIITERKQVVELAHAAVIARTPLWVIGKPYSESDVYFQQFRAFAQAHPDIVRYEGAIANRSQLAQIYRQARGFVLLSKWETLSLSALEAAACECPLLLSDLPWAKSHFDAAPAYCPLTRSIPRIAACLRKFYDAAPGLRPPPKPASWADVATQFKTLYGQLLTSPAHRSPAEARLSSGAAI